MSLARWLHPFVSMDFVLCFILTPAPIAVLRAVGVWFSLESFGLALALAFVLERGQDSRSSQAG